MAMTVREVREWLDGLADDEEIGIDDGGMILLLVSDPENTWLEIGGLPE